MKQHCKKITVAVLTVLLLTMPVGARGRMLIPGGCTVGIKLVSEGLVVTGFEQESSAEQAGLRKGDVIIQVDGAEIHTVAALQESLDEDTVVLTVLRNGKEAEFCVKPRQTAEGRRLGAYVRDSVAGIGTVTYYDPNTGAFGALGHGVNDSTTSDLMPMEAGVVVESAVSDVEKGKIGQPGELRGSFRVTEILGEVEENTAYGIFGHLTVPVAGTPLPVADSEEVETGAAQILANVQGRDVALYDVEIVKVFPQSQESGRNLLLKITDPALLESTGGIVQGMSGSPILQNGKLVGAVTHVLVNDPTQGYGIFLENMLEASE